MRMTRSDRIFTVLNYLLMLIVILCSIYPVWYCIVLSVSNLNTVSVYEISFWPIEFTTKNYEQVFKDTQLLNSIKISVARTVFGAGFHVLCCAMAAYALSRREMIFNKFFTSMLLVTMFFGGISGTQEMNASAAIAVTIIFLVICLSVKRRTTCSSNDSAHILHASLCQYLLILYNIVHQ